YVLGNYDRLGHDYLLYPSIVPKASIISSIALICFMLGYLWRADRTIKLGQSRPGFSAQSNNSRLLVIMGYVFFFIFFIFSNKDYFRGQYGQVDLGTTAQYMQQLLIYTVFGIVIVNCRDIVYRKHRIRN